MYYSNFTSEADELKSGKVLNLTVITRSRRASC